MEQQGAPQRGVWRRNHLPYGDGEMEVGGGLGSSSVLPSLAGPLTRGVAVQSGRYSKWVKKEVGPQISGRDCWDGGTMAMHALCWGTATPLLSEPPPP